MTDRNDDVLTLLRSQNKQTVKRIREEGDTLDGEKCIAKSVFNAHADGQEQTFRNQEFMIEHMLGGPVNGNGNGRKKFTMFNGLLSLEGFGVRDILRIVVVLFLLWVWLHINGMSAKLDAIGGGMAPVAAPASVEP